MQESSVHETAYMADTHLCYECKQSLTFIYLFCRHLLPAKSYGYSTCRYVKITLKHLKINLESAYHFSKPCSCLFLNTQAYFMCKNVVGTAIANGV